MTQQEIDVLFEQLLKDNQDVLYRLKNKDEYTVEDFLNSRKEDNKLLT
jgi:hypothetical protein